MGYNENISDQNNYLDILKDVRRIPNIWKQKGVTLAGKIVIVELSWFQKYLT